MAVLNISINPQGAVSGGQQVRQSLDSISQSSANTTSAVNRVVAEMVRLNEIAGQQRSAIEQVNQSLSRQAESFRQVEQSAKSSGSVLASVGDSLKRIVETAAGVSLSGLFSSLVSQAKEFATQGIQVNAQLEGSRTAIAALLQGTTKLTDAHGQTVNATAAWKVNLQQAGEVQQRIAEMSASTLGTQQELLDVFRGVLAFGSSQKASLEQQLQLSQGILNVGKLQGLNSALLEAETRQILTLESARGQVILPLLGLTVQQARQYREQGTLVQELNTRLAVYKQLAEDSALTWTGLTTTISSFSSLVSAGLFSNAFAGVKEILVGMRDEFNQLRQSGDLTSTWTADVQALRNLGAISADVWTRIERGIAQATETVLAFGAALGKIDPQTGNSPLKSLGDFIAGEFAADFKTIDEVIVPSLQRLYQAYAFAGAAVERAKEAIAHPIAGPTTTLNDMKNIAEQAGIAFKQTWEDIKAGDAATRQLSANLGDARAQVDAYYEALNREGKNKPPPDQHIESLKAQIAVMEQQTRLYQEVTAGTRTLADAQAHAAAIQAGLKDATGQLTGSIEAHRLALEKAKQAAEAFNKAQEQNALLDAKLALLKQVSAGTLQYADYLVKLAGLEAAAKDKGNQYAAGIAQKEEAFKRLNSVEAENYKAQQQLIQQDEAATKATADSIDKMQAQIAGQHFYQQALMDSVHAGKSWEESLHAAKTAADLATQGQEVYTAALKRYRTDGVEDAEFAAQTVQNLFLYTRREMDQTIETTKNMETQFRDSFVNIGSIIENSIKDIITRTGNLGDEFANFGIDLAAKFGKQFLIGKQNEFDIPFIGNIQGLVGQNGIIGTLLGTGGATGAASYAGSFLENLGLTGSGGLLTNLGLTGPGGFLTSITSNLLPNMGLLKEGTSILSGAFSPGIDTLDSLITGGGRLLSGIGSLGSGFLGSLAGGGLAGLFGANSSEAGMGGNIGGGIGGAIGTFLLPGIGTFLGSALGDFIGSMFGDLFAHVPTKGTQIRQSDVQQLKKLGIAGSGSLNPNLYGFDWTKQQGGDFLSASQGYIGANFPYLQQHGQQSELEALGVAFTSTEAEKLKKDLNQTSITFANMIAANLGNSESAVDSFISDMVSKGQVTAQNLTAKITDSFQKGLISAQTFRDALEGVDKLFKITETQQKNAAQETAKQTAEAAKQATEAAAASAKAAAEASAAAIKALIDQTQQNLSDLQKQEQRFANETTSLRKALNDLALGSESPASPARKVQLAGTMFDDAIRAGTVEDRVSTGQAYLQVARAAYGSSATYQNIYRRVTSVFQDTANEQDALDTATRQQIAAQLDRLYNLQHGISLASGGIVMGPAGQAVPAVLHPPEMVIPLGGNGGNVPIQNVIHLTVITESGQAITEQTLQTLMNRSASGEHVIDLRGVRQ